MENTPLNAARRAALASLLDDVSPAVRRALLKQFGDLGTEARQFLEEIARGPNRLLGWHASWFLTELKFTDPVAEFRGFIRSLSYELETGALLLARTVNSDIDIGAVCHQLDAMAARCRELFTEPSTMRDRCRVLNRVVFHENGFRGDADNYTDPRNSFLDEVLRRRRGLPITLSIVYLLVAQRCGLQLEPVGMPGHFVVGCYQDTPPFFIDPFDGGAFRSADELMDMLRRNHLTPKITDLAPTPVREVLHRCCRNLVHHYNLANNPERGRLFAEFVAEFESTYARETAE